MSAFLARGSLAIWEFKVQNTFCNNYENQISKMYQDFEVVEINGL